MVLKLTDADVAAIRSRHAGGLLQKDLAVAYGVSQGTISLVVSRRLHTGIRKSTSRKRKRRVDAEGRECCGCGRYKLWTEYHLSPRSSTGYMSRCKPCRGRGRLVVGPGQGANARVFVTPEAAERKRRDLYLRYMYGISIDQYDWLADQQDHKCWLCLEPESVNRQSIAGRQRDSLGVDHDHSCSQHSGRHACTRCIRGLLCDACNRMIGFAEGRGPAVAARFSDYLGRRPLLDGGR